jgi:hypothetical protein
MTQAQKTAKAKFKQAIAYRQKTGVTLKEAFSHIYGKKKVVKKAVKKSAPKKKAIKKVAKKRIAGPKDSKLIKKELAKKGLKMPHGYTTVKRKRKISGVKKKPTESQVLKTIQKAVSTQEKHMISGIEDRMFKDLLATRERIANTKQAIIKLQGVNKNEILQKDRFLYAKKLKDYKNYLIELNTHYRELKKHI